MPQMPPAATVEADQNANGIPERILVVEDDKIIRALVTTTLESHGIPFLTASTLALLSHWLLRYLSLNMVFTSILSFEW